MHTVLFSLASIGFALFFILWFFAAAQHQDAEDECRSAQDSCRFWRDRSQEAHAMRKKVDEENRKLRGRIKELEEESADRETDMDSLFDLMDASVTANDKLRAQSIDDNSAIDFWIYQSASANDKLSAQSVEDEGVIDFWIAQFDETLALWTEDTKALEQARTERNALQSTLTERIALIDDLNKQVIGRDLQITALTASLSALQERYSGLTSAYDTVKANYSYRTDDVPLIYGALNAHEAREADKIGAYSVDREKINADKAKAAPRLSRTVGKVMASKLVRGRKAVRK